jgi:hypothetical protein
MLLYLFAMNTVNIEKEMMMMLPLASLLYEVQIH